MRIGLRYAHGDREKALENTNTAFLHIVQKLERYNPQVPFQAWIQRIMINVTIDDFRKNKAYLTMVQTASSETMATYEAVTGGNEAEWQLESQEVLQIVSQLPEPTAHIFNLFVFDEYTHREIANLLNITESASKWHVAKAKTLLKSYLQSHYPTLIAPYIQDETA